MNDFEGFEDTWSGAAAHGREEDAVAIVIVND